MTDNQAVMDDKTLYIAIKARLEKADVEIAAQNWESANGLVKQALAELGDRYSSPSLRDDSGMSLVIAEVQEKKEGKLDSAVHLRRDILAERLERLRSKIR